MIPMSMTNVTKTTDPNSGIVIGRADSTENPSQHNVCAADPSIGLAIGATWDRESCSFIGASMTVVGQDGQHNHIGLSPEALHGLGLNEGIDYLHDTVVLAPFAMLAGLLDDLDGQ